MSATVAAQTDLVIEVLTPSSVDAWDEYVRRHPLWTPFHLTAWRKTLVESFGYKPVYLMAMEGNAVYGILPLFLVSGWFTGRALISTPFAVYGGILADSATARDALYTAAKRVGDSLNVDYIEFRNMHVEQCAGEPNVSRYVTFTCQPPAGEEGALLEWLPRKVRNKVRKSLKTPFEMRRRVPEIDNFYRLQSATMRRLGTPAFPRRYFQSILDNFGDMVEVCEVSLDGKLAATGMNLYYRDQMHSYYAAADTRISPLEPNTWMYFDYLQSAGERGLTFDFGRSKTGTGPFEFKRHWNTDMRPLPYEIVPVRRKELPNISPANPRFSLAIRCWQRLPLAVTRWLGPKLIRLFP